MAKYRHKVFGELLLMQEQIFNIKMKIIQSKGLTCNPKIMPKQQKTKFENMFKKMGLKELF